MILAIKNFEDSLHTAHIHEAINFCTLFILGMMKIHLFLGLVAMASILFCKVSAKPPIIKSEYEFAMNHDSIKLSEYIKNLEKVAGFQLNPKQIKGAKMDFEIVDKNGNGLLEVQEMIDQKLDASDHLREPNKGTSLFKVLEEMLISLFPRSLWNEKLPIHDSPNPQE